MSDTPVESSDPGILTVFSGRSVTIRDEYDSRLNRARHRVEVLGFGLRSFREDYGDKLEDLGRRARVRLLLLDPDFPNAAPYAEQRDREERNPSGSIGRDVREFLLQSSTATSNDESDIQVRLYSALPMVNIFRVDDEMFWGPYLLHDQSRNAPTMLVHSDGFLFKRLAEHFDALWTDEWSKPLA